MGVREWGWWCVLAGVAGCATGPDEAALREQIKQEVLAELRGEEASREPPPPATEDSGAAVATAAARPAGRVHGRITWQGTGVANCRVQLQPSDAAGRTRPAPGRSALAARTERSGRFAFPRVPVGAYRLRWQLPGDDGWLRRVRRDPDVIVPVPGRFDVPEIRLRRPIGSGW